MSKAEKFIEKNTNTTYNYNSYAQDPEPWLTPDQARKTVEIAMEEMIEKAVLYVIYKTRTVHYNNYDTREFNKSSLDDIINDLKQAMKEE